MRKALILFSISFKNMVMGTIMSVLLLGIVLPMSNYEIRALFVSVDVIERAPYILETLTLSQLNNVVMKGFFKDNDYDKSGKPLDKKSNNTGKVFDTNLSYTLTSGTKKPVEAGYYILSKIFHGYCLNLLDVVDYINIRICDYGLNIPINYYALSLRSTFMLPRSSIDVNDVLVNNIIYKNVILNYLTIINPILI